jgi:hypothetical protein
MTFAVGNQLYKKITVQLSVKGKEGMKKLLLGNEWIRKGLCFG